MNALAKIVASCLAEEKKKRPKGFKGFATFLAPSQLGVCDVVNLEWKKKNTV